MIFFSQNEIKLISVRNMIQVIDSIPWIRCAMFFLQLVVQTFFSTFFQLFFNFFSTFFNFFSTFFSTFIFIFSELFFLFQPFPTSFVLHIKSSTLCLFIQAKAMVPSYISNVISQSMLPEKFHKIRTTKRPIQCCYYFHKICSNVAVIHW